jgi:hypothetical protein
VASNRSAIAAKLLAALVTALLEAGARTTALKVCDQNLLLVYAAGNSIILKTVDCFQLIARRFLMAADTSCSIVNSCKALLL